MSSQDTGLNAWLEEIDYKSRVKAVCKPCWEVKYCPYGILVEHFPLVDDIDTESRCRIYGHECPVFSVAEPFTETRELRKISRSISRPTQFRVLKRDNQICRICGKAILDENIHFDHIIPWSKGGSSDENNIQLLCEECNRKKSNNFDQNYLVEDLADRISKPFGYEILDFLHFVVGFSHVFYNEKGHCPTEDDIANELAEGDKTDAEITAANVVSDLKQFFYDPKPEEMADAIFNALRFRWGFETGQIAKLKEACNKYDVHLNEMFSAELDLVQRLGWRIKLSKSQETKWKNH